MREGWTYKKLIDECSVLYGYPFDSKCFSSSSEDMPLIRIRDVKEGKTSTYYNGEYSKEYIVHRGDYLIGMDGEFNISQWQSEDALLNQRVCKISSKTSLLLMRYIYRFLVKELKKIEDETPFVTVKHLSAKKINQIIIPIPPLAEQERIVEELDLLSGIIEKKKEQLKAYDQLAQSIFYDMFGDPIYSPKGWEIKKLGEVVSFIADGDWIESKDQSENGIRLIQTGNIGCGSFIAKDDKPHFISEATFANLGCTEIYAGDCLISRLPAPVGRACIIPETNYRMITAVDCTIVRFGDSILPEFFIYHSLCSSYQAEIDRKTTGTTRKRISRKNLEIIPIPVPPLSLQQEFAEKVEAIERQKALVQQSIEETQTMLDYTMDKYFG